MDAQIVLPAVLVAVDAAVLEVVAVDAEVVFSRNFLLIFTELNFLGWTAVAVVDEDELEWLWFELS